MDFSGPLFQLWSNLEQEEDLLDYGGHEGALENRTKSAPGSSGTGMMGLRQRAAGLCGRGRQATRTKAVLRPASGARCENMRSAGSTSGTTEPCLS